jgi:glutamate racemase
MIGLFDTGHGGLTIYRALASAMPQHNFVYLGDHANAPYGQRTGQEILALTKDAIITLFARGCPLVVLACNTATAVALRRVQQDWLPHSKYKHHRVLGIIAPTVEAATGIAWMHGNAQNHKQDLVVVFGTQRTIETGVYAIEIRKRSPMVRVIQQICPSLAGAIETGADAVQLETHVRRAVDACMQQTHGIAPHHAILGCTHFPIVEHLFKKYLPATTPILSQGIAVAQRLQEYVMRHPEFNQTHIKHDDIFLTSGEAPRVSHDAQRLLGMTLKFENIAISPILL